MNTRQRLYHQAAMLTIAATDLRHFVVDTEFKDIVNLARDFRDACWDYYRYDDVNTKVWDQESQVDWAKARLEHRLGIKKQTFFAPGQTLEEHTPEDDMRTVLQFLRDVRGY